MRKMAALRFSVVISGLIVMGTVVGGFASDIGPTIQQTCTKCHSPKRICLNLGVKSESAWNSTINKMVGKGAKLPKDRINEAASFLSTLEPGAPLLCN